MNKIGGLFNSTQDGCPASALLSNISLSALFYLLFRAIFQSNSHYIQFSSALPSHMFRQDPRIQPSVPEQDPGVLPGVPEQDLRILPNEPEQDPGILENIEQTLGTLSQ